VQVRTGILKFLMSNKITMLDFMTAWLGSACVTFVTHRDLAPCVHNSESSGPLSGVSLANVSYTMFILANVTSIWTILKGVFFKVSACRDLDDSRGLEYQQSAAIVAVRKKYR